MSEIIWQPATRYGMNDCRAPTLPTRPDPWTDAHTASNDCRFALSADTIEARRSGATPVLQLLRPHLLLRTLPLDAEHVVAFVPSLSQVAVLNSAARTLLARLPLRVAEIDAATQDALMTLYTLGILTEHPTTTLHPPPAANILAGWLHVTNACNLRCTYCYIHKTNEAMSEQTARGAVDSIVRSALAHGYQEIALKYAGGEALLELPLVEYIHTYALGQADKYGLRLQATLLSNGTGLAAYALQTLRRLGVYLTISIDGLAGTHDVQRPTLGGRGSAVAALRGIEQAIEMQLAPLVAITVTGQSVAGVPALVGWLLERDLQFSISFYRDHDCSSSRQQLQLDEQQIIEGMRQVYAVIGQRLPRWSLLGALLDRADLSAPHHRTCAVGENYLVIDHHGRIAKCQMTINQPITTIDAANPLALIRADRAGVQNVPVDQKEGCHSCEWRYWCAGGCAIATYRATGRYDIQSPNCAIYKSLYPDVLRLEGLRLLHWGQIAPAQSTSQRADSIPVYASAM